MKYMISQEANKIIEPKYKIQTYCGVGGMSRVFG